MKPTQITELLANIRKTFVSFFSILMFVALGVGIFVGINWTSPALENVAESEFDKGSFHNFQIQFPYGLTDGDLEKLSQVEGVTQVEPGYQSFQKVTADDTYYSVKVQSMGEVIDTLIVVEGELPAREGEIALLASAAEQLGWGVGDTIRFDADADEDASDGAGAGETAGAAASDGAASSDDEGMKLLKHPAFKVTALVDSPEYISTEHATYGVSLTPSGTIHAVAWVLPEEFDGQAFQDGYPIVNVRCDSLAGLNTFSKEYANGSRAIGSRITELGDVLATERYDDLHDKVQQQIDDGQAQLDDAKQQIATGEQQLVDGRAQLETERADGEAKLAEAYQLLLSYESQKAQAERELAYYRSTVAGAESDLAEVDAAAAEVRSLVDDASAYKAKLDAQLKKGKITQKEYDEALDKYGSQVTASLKPLFNELGMPAPAIDHTNYDSSLAAARAAVDNYEDIPFPYNGEMTTVREARAKLDEGKRMIAYGEQELYSKSAQLSDGWAQYYAGQDELNAKVAEGEQMLADGARQVDEAKALVAEKEPLLEDAKEQLAAMTKYDWSVMPRSYNAGVAQVATFSAVTMNLSFSMAALFVIVGLLVSYSAVSRIVHEQVTQIGTKKALGLRAGEITTSFLAYSALAVIAGAIIGAIVGFVLVESIIGHALGSMFVFGDYPAYFGWPLFLGVTALELALVLGATWLACRSILRQHAVELLRGEKPPEAKQRFFEKWAVWDKLPLLTQTMVNNCLNDKRRMFSTVVGVAGCTALIVTAITLNNDVLKSYDLHYENVYRFNDIIYVDNEVEGAADAVRDKLEGEGCASAVVVHKTFAYTRDDGASDAVYAVSPEDEEAFSKVYRVRPVSGGVVDLSKDGAWVTQAYANHLGAKVGDTMRINAGDGMTHEVPILGFYDFQLTYHEVLMGRDYYEREFGDFAPNAVLADSGDMTLDEVKAEVSSVDGFDSIVDDKTYQKGNFDTFSGVSSTVVLIYLALATLMAVVVLLNLNVMFIDEKKRELIVLMINGFSVKDAKRYIYNDTIVLSAIGILLGLLLGCLMGAITVGAIEPSTATFEKGVDWVAVLVGVVGSALLATIMSVIALRRIPRFELTDINRF